jgi:hypothetical protein
MYKKLDWADARIKELKYEFLDEFLSTLDDIHKLSSGYERDQFIWKAKSRRHDFFDGLWKLRKELSKGLSKERAALVEDMDYEWKALLAALDANRTLLAEESARLTQELWDGANELRLDLDDHITAVDEWLDERLLHEGHEL